MLQQFYSRCGKLYWKTSEILVIGIKCRHFLKPWMETSPPPRRTFPFSLLAERIFLQFPPFRWASDSRSWYFWILVPGTVRCCILELVPCAFSYFPKLLNVPSSWVRYLARNCLKYKMNTPKYSVLKPGRLIKCSFFFISESVQNTRDFFLV